MAYGGGLQLAGRASRGSPNDLAREGYLKAGSTGSTVAPMEVQVKEERVACRTGSKDEKSTSSAASTISRNDGNNLLEDQAATLKKINSLDS
ncbi:hypothetical protein WJX75_003613 [Coccomyxa subellipsoidea]|uniref:Uncharacterized protein n=1 Tax=Coccomyxa subellipsoidea TaxID=248742 RepID=A0ABR2Z4H1_9CHLO